MNTSAASITSLSSSSSSTSPSSLSTSSSSSLFSLNDTWEYFIGLSNKEKLVLMEQLRDLGISEEDLRLLYGHFDPHEDDLRFLHIPEFRAHKALMLWVPPVLLLLGTMGNTCSFAVLWQKTMRQQSIYIYLCALAVFDSLVLYVGLLRLWLGEVTGSDIRNSSSWLCKGTLMLGYTCSDVSVWLIVAVTVERYIVVCHPLQARAFCQQLRAKLIIIGTVLVFSLVNLHLLFSTALVESTDDHDRLTLDSSKTSSDGAPASYARRMTCGPLPGYGFVVNVVWPWVDAMLYGLGPFILISILNTVIILKIYRANSTRAELTNGAARKDNHQLPAGRGGIGAAELLVSKVDLSQSVDSTSDAVKPTTNLVAPAPPLAPPLSPLLAGPRPVATGEAAGGSLRMTVMLLSVSFTFMLTTLPMTIANIVANTVVNTGGRSEESVARWLLAHTLALLLMYLNHSVNFLLYCVTGKKFRKVVTRMYSAKVCALIHRKSPETTPLDHSEHLYCSRRNASRCGAETARSFSSQENHV